MRPTLVILAWDLCNEPFNSGDTAAYLPWLTHTYKLAKTLGAEQPLGVSVGASVGHLRDVEPCSDVLMIHPYFAESCKMGCRQSLCGQAQQAFCWPFGDLLGIA